MQVITVCLMILIGVFSASSNSGDSNSSTSSSAGSLGFSNEQLFSQENESEENSVNFLVSDEDENNVKPVPEPATFLLLGPALLGLMSLKRKK